MLKKGVKRKTKKKEEKEKKESKGLSSIVATLLVILITLVAVGILWVVIRNVIINQSELAKAQSEFFSENVQITSFNINNGLANISLKKTGGSIKTTTQNQTSEITEVIEADIISVVDLSGSMRSCNGINSSCCSSLGGSYNIYPSGSVCAAVNLNKQNNCTSICGGIWVDRLAASQNANKELASTILESEGSRIGLVGYDSTVINSASLNLTNNLAQLNNKIDSWEIGSNTCICCGINEAVKKLQQQSSSEKSKKIIVMSDGEANQRCIEQNTSNSAQDAIKASCDAYGNLSNLIVYSIGFGENANEEVLTNISNCGRGKYFSAMNVSELIDVYTSVVEDIRTTYQSTKTFNYLFVVFYNETSSYTEKIPEIPDILSIKKYQFDLTGKLEGEIIKIEIFPVIITDKGKEIIGPASDVWEKSK
jgi:flagellin-like protein